MSGELVFCEDCAHAINREMLPDLWRCSDSPIGEGSKRQFVRRTQINDFQRCEVVNARGRCLRFLHLGDSREDNPQGGG